MPIGGEYQTFLDSGNYTVRVQLNNAYHTVTPASVPVSFPALGVNDTIDFAVSVIPNIHDCALYTSVLSATRPGFEGSLRLQYSNKGTVDETNKEVIFIKTTELHLLVHL